MAIFTRPVCNRSPGVRVGVLLLKPRAGNSHRGNFGHLVIFQTKPAPSTRPRRYRFIGPSLPWETRDSAGFWKAFTLRLGVS
jgi:hypothetical protein